MEHRPVIMLCCLEVQTVGLQDHIIVSKVQLIFEIKGLIV
jgi:hypothetical protein